MTDLVLFVGNSMNIYIETQLINIIRKENKKIQKSTHVLSSPSQFNSPIRFVFYAI